MKRDITSLLGFMSLSWLFFELEPAQPVSAPPEEEEKWIFIDPQPED